MEATIDHTELSQTIASIHISIIQLARMIVEQWTDVLPVQVTIEKSGDDVRITVNGENVTLTALEKQAVITLSLLEYRKPFSVIEFAGLLPSPKEGASPEAKTRFDTGLRFLKKFEPFSWIASSGDRSVKGLNH